MTDTIITFLSAQSSQIALLFAIVIILHFALRRASAHWRYLLWCLLLAKCLIPPVFTLPLAILPSQSALTVTLPASQPETYNTQPPSCSVAQLETIKPQQSSPSLVQLETRTSQQPSSSAVSAAVNSSSPQLEMRKPQQAAFILSVAWLAGVIVFLIITTTRAFFLHRWILRTRKAASADFVAHIATIASRLKLASAPRVYFLPSISQPFVWGIIRGSLYLPENFQSESSEHRDSILLHELAHILRFDALINFLQIIAQALFFFHPFVWLANNIIRRQREMCCDEMALAHLGLAPSSYGQAIVNTLVREYKDSRSLPSLCVAGPVKNIEERIKTIMTPNKKFYCRPTIIAILTTLLLATFTIPLGCRLSQKNVTQHTITGTVTDALGNPIVGATVGDSQKYNNGEYKTTTDSTGHYTYKTFYEEHIIAAKSRGYMPAEKTFKTRLFSSPERTTIDFALEPDFYIITFKPKGSFTPTTSRILLDEFNQNHPPFRSHHYRTEVKDNMLIGHICIDTSPGRDAVIKMLQASDSLEFVSSAKATGQSFNDLNTKLGQPDLPSSANPPQSSYPVDKNVRDFPDNDFSTPQGAYAAINKLTSADAANWSKVSTPEIAKLLGKSQSGPTDPAWAKVLLNAQILEVYVKDDKAIVAAKLLQEFSSEPIRNPIDLRYLEKIEGKWLNTGNDRVDSLVQALANFNRWTTTSSMNSKYTLPNPDEIKTAAANIFQKIRTADYNYYSKPDAWRNFPTFGIYTVHTDYPSFVKWICSTFKTNPIISVQLGDVLINDEKLPAVPYTITLKDHRTLQGVLPFKYESHWCGVAGLDWRLHDPFTSPNSQPTTPPESVKSSSKSVPSVASLDPNLDNDPNTKLVKFSSAMKLTLYNDDFASLKNAQIFDFTTAISSIHKDLQCVIHGDLGVAIIKAAGPLLFMPVENSQWDRLDQRQYFRIMLRSDAYPKITIKDKAKSDLTYFPLPPYTAWFFDPKANLRGLLRISDFNSIAVTVEYKLLLSDPMLEFKAADFVQVFTDRHFDQARAYFDDKMKSVLPATALEQLWHQLSDVGGKITSIGQISKVEHLDPYTILYVPVTWEKNKLDFKIVFDTQNRISGLWTVAPNN